MRSDADGPSPVVKAELEAKKVRPSATWESIACALTVWID